MISYFISGFVVGQICAYLFSWWLHIQFRKDVEDVLTKIRKELTE